MNSDQRRRSLFPKTLADCVEPLTRPLLKTQGLAGSRLLAEWDAIVGPQLAAHTLPEKIAFPKGKKTEGTLTIAVESGFALELQYKQPAILERLAGYYGYQAISRIVISHGFVQAAPQAAPKLPAAPIAKRPGFGNAVKDIDDDSLRKALDSLARTLSGE